MRELAWDFKVISEWGQEEASPRQSGAAAVGTLPSAKGGSAWASLPVCPNVEQKGRGSDGDLKAVSSQTSKLESGFLCLFSPKLHGPLLCRFNLFPEPRQPRWLTSSRDHLHLCDFLNKLLLGFEKKMESDCLL